MSISSWTLAKMLIFLMKDDLGMTKKASAFLAKTFPKL